jgi:type IV pilus assembly protein PilB
MEAAAAFKHPRLRLGALLLRNGLLTAEQLAEALEEREQTGVRIGEIVVQRGWVSDEDLARTLAEQFAIDFVDLDAIAPDPTTGRLLSIDVARSVRAVPVEVSHGAAVVAVADPTGEALEVLTSELDLPVELAVAPASAIDRAIDRIHPAGEEIESAEPESTVTAPLAGEPEAYSAIEWFDQRAPTVLPEAADEPAETPEDAETPTNVAPLELGRPLLGTLLLRDDLITAGQLAEALIEKEATEERLGEILLRNGWITEVALSRLLAEQFAVVYVDLDASPPDERANMLLSGALARYFWAVPVRFLDNDTVLVAIADPTAFGVDDLERAIGFRVVLGLATESAIAAAVERLEMDEDTSRPQALGDDERTAAKASSTEDETVAEAADDTPVETEPEDSSADALFPTLRIVDTVDPAPQEEPAAPELPSWIGPSIADAETPAAEASAEVAATPWDGWAAVPETDPAEEPAPPAPDDSEPTATENIPDPPPWSWLDAVTIAAAADTGETELDESEPAEAAAADELTQEAPAEPADETFLVAHPEYAAEAEEPEPPVIDEPQAAVVDEPQPAPVEWVEPVADVGPETPVAEEPEAVEFTWAKAPALDEPETPVAEEPEPVVFEWAEPAADVEPETPVAEEPDAMQVTWAEAPALDEPETPVAEEPEPVVFEWAEPVADVELEAPIAKEPEAATFEWAEPAAAVEEPEREEVDEPEPVAVEEPSTEAETLATVDESAVDEHALESAAEDIELSAGPSADELVDGLLRLAVEEGASDLHFEPQADRLVVRARVDGVMQELYSAPTPLADALIDRLERIGGLSVVGRRPQEEQVTFTLDSDEIDARVTVAPTPHGSRVVLRFARAARELMLEQLGLAPDAAEQLQRAIARPYGAVIVAGPREGGATTTLYAALRELDARSRCLMTIEDPIAVPLPGVGQIQVDREAGLGFAEGLRTILASDPDVVLVGDLADPETAWTAFDAAVTGQFLLAAMKAEDIGGAVSRLTEMGVGRELLAAATNCLVAQRLARKLCPGCREPYDVHVEELIEAGAREADLPVGGSVTLYRAAGCSACAGGYRGRVGMFEALLVTSEIRRLLETGTAEELHQAAVAGGMRTLHQDGLRLCLLGHTSLDEIKRVAGDPR